MRDDRQRWAALWVVGVYLGAVLGAPPVAAAERAELAAEGRALMNVVVGDEASEAVRASAATLAAYLSRISGAEFQVVPGDGAAGIVMGLPADFVALPMEAAFKTGPYDREDYILQSNARGVWLLGATEMAVEHAVWDLLYRLGHRQYFPGETWEIVAAAGRAGHRGGRDGAAGLLLPADLVQLGLLGLQQRAVTPSGVGAIGIVRASS